MARIVATLSLFVAVFSLGSLITNPNYVDTVLPGGLPTGNLLAAAALCSLASAALLLSPDRTLRCRVSKALLLAALSWLPVSILLAGNLELNFQGLRGTIWMAGSVGLAAAVCACLVWTTTGCLLGLRQRPGAP